MASDGTPDGAQPPAPNPGWLARIRASRVPGALAAGLLVAAFGGGFLAAKGLEAVSLFGPKDPTAKVAPGAQAWSLFGKPRAAGAPRRGIPKPEGFAAWRHPLARLGAEALHLRLRLRRWGGGARHRIEDAPRRFGDYQPENFDRVFRGKVTAREALTHSLNVPAVEMLEKIGASSFEARMRGAGIALVRPRSPTRAAGLALALGGVGISLRDLAVLYAALGDEGIVKPLASRPMDRPCRSKPSARRRAGWLSPPEAKAWPGMWVASRLGPIRSAAGSSGGQAGPASTV